MQFRTVAIAVSLLGLARTYANGSRVPTGSLADADKFQVMYGDVVVGGQMLGEDQTSKAPHIAAPEASEFHLYTVIMYDPDAPNPDAPICKNWVHWIYIDAKGKHLTGGTSILAYNGPTPPEGTHNYHISLYQQPAELSDASAPKSRCKFSPANFARDNGLTLVADVTFKVAAGSA